MNFEKKIVVLSFIVRIIGNIYIYLLMVIKCKKQNNCKNILEICVTVKIFLM